MAKITADAAASLTAAGSGTARGSITWASPLLPEDAVISSVLLTGSWRWNGKGAISSVTINGTNTLPGTAFSIELGSDTVPPLQISCTGNKNATGSSFAWQNLIVTYTYTVPGLSSDIYVKVAGTYREAKAVYMKKNGVYTEITKDELQSLSKK